MLKSKAKTPDSLRPSDNAGKAEESLIGALVNDFLITPSFFDTLTYVNIFIFYVVVLLYIANFQLTFWSALLYIPLLFLLNILRKSRQEKERLEIAHTIPFFADAMSNALSVGETLEQAFIQASFYLKGRIKNEFQKLALKHTLGKNLDVLLRTVDAKFPNTGLLYLISLLNSYSELGVGISPLLKRIALVLTTREKAEEKIRSILAGGSHYAWLTVFIFLLIFLALGFLLKDQLKYLVSPQLKPIFIFLVIWMAVGILIVTRITSLDYTRSSSMKPYVTHFFSLRTLSHEEMLKYSGIKWVWWKTQLYEYGPVFVGFVFAYLVSGFSEDFFAILISFGVGYGIAKMLENYIISGFVEDQLINTIETFPEILQIFIIGLNSGLNNYLAFQFAMNAIKGNTPKILEEELCRTKHAQECSEDPARTWHRLAQRIPFEIVVDFAEIMAIAPMHGASILNSIIEMTDSYQGKKLLLIEKKATQIGQFIIPIIIIAFFPLFLFFVFAPMISKITSFVT